MEDQNYLPSEPVFVLRGRRPSAPRAPARPPFCPAKSPGARGRTAGRPRCGACSERTSGVNKDAQRPKACCLVRWFGGDPGWLSINPQDKKPAQTGVDICKKSAMGFTRHTENRNHCENPRISPWIPRCLVRTLPGKSTSAASRTATRLMWVSCPGRDPKTRGERFGAMTGRFEGG